MSKKKSQILSPENYIRQRARNLPVYKCLLNENWEEMGLAYIFISRKHTNGNITFCNYLVDLKCLGIKDTFYYFNIPAWEFDEIVESIPLLDFIDVEYNLVHNIIHAAWEYAEELDFEPHKDFLSITRFMLDEDTDDIPLMEIKCGGENDKPVYIQGETESDSRAKAILNHLEKKVGKGNFEFIIPGTEDWIDDEDWGVKKDLYEQKYENYEYYYDLYEKSDKENNISSFLAFVEQMESGLDSFEQCFTDISQLYALVDAILNDILDEKRVEAWNEKWRDELKSIHHIEIETKITAKTIGLSKDQEFSSADSDYLNSDIDENAENKFIKKRWGETPLTLFRKIMEMKTSKRKEQKLDKALNKYPEYSLLRILKFIVQIENESLIEPIFDFDYIFPNKKEVSPEEFVLFQILKFHYFRHNNDLEGTDSLFHYVEFLEENDDLPLDELSTLIFIERLFMISNYLKKTAGN